MWRNEMNSVDWIEAWREENRRRKATELAAKPVPPGGQGRRKATAAERAAVVDYLWQRNGEIC